MHRHTTWKGKIALVSVLFFKKNQFYSLETLFSFSFFVHTTDTTKIVLVLTFLAGLFTCVRINVHLISHYIEPSECIFLHVINFIVSPHIWLRYCCWTISTYLQVSDWPNVSLHPEVTSPPLASAGAWHQLHMRFQKCVFENTHVLQTRQMEKYRDSFTKTLTFVCISVIIYLRFKFEVFLHVYLRLHLYFAHPALIVDPPIDWYTGSYG